MSMARFLFVCLVATWSAACGQTVPRSGPQAASIPPAVEGGAQIGFRLRSDFRAGLNADAGWAAAYNEGGTVFADQPFRIRFAILADYAPAEAQFRLQYRRNGGVWTDIEAHDFPHPESDDAQTPRVSIVSCSAFRNGEPTKKLLPGAEGTFQSGAGVALADRTSAWSGSGSHAEYEWALVIRRFADDAATNEQGDRFELRMINADGSELEHYIIPVLRLSIPPRHVGGTFVETPGRIGPWQAKNGDLYFIMEPAETSNLFMMIKSSDNGRTWREIGAANRPPTRDLESVDSRHVGDTIHILHQVTRSSLYHSFRTSDHPMHPDTWAVRAEQISGATSVAQAASLVVRSDGSMAAFYVGPAKVHYSVRSPAGSWSPEAIVDSDIAPNTAGPQAVLGANDVVHLAYYGTDGTIWYRRLHPDGTLTPREQLASGVGATRAEFGSVLPLIFIPETNTLVILYRLADGFLWERRIVNDGPPTPPGRVADRKVVRNAVDSQQPAADAVLDGRTVRVLFIEESSRSIFSTHDQGGWQPSTLRVDRILGSWVRGNVYTRKDGVRVYGFVYDAGSDGGAGMNRFDEIVLTE